MDLGADGSLKSCKSCGHSQRCSKDVPSRSDVWDRPGGVGMLGKEPGNIGRQQKELYQYFR